MTIPIVFFVGESLNRQLKTVRTGPLFKSYGSIEKRDVGHFMYSVPFLGIQGSYFILESN